MQPSEIIELLKQSLSIGGLEMFLKLIKSNFIPEGLQPSEIIDLLKQSLSIGGFEMFLNLINSTFIPEGFDFSQGDTFGISLMNLATTTANDDLISVLKGTLKLF